MPELPEVETVVRLHRPLVCRRVIASFRSFWQRNCTPSAAVIRKRISGRRVTKLHRRAKFIVFDFDRPGHLLIHLRMSGRFSWLDAAARRPQHARAVIEFVGGGRLWFVDARKFGRIAFVDDLAAATAHLGVEPLERSFSARRLRVLLAERARRIKPLLLDQSVVAGLGNIYVDEALHKARIHPLERADRLGPDRVRGLCAAIKYVLRKGIRQNGASIDWVYPGGTMQDHLLVYGRTGEPCRRCGTVIEALRVAQRGTHVCPRCQANPGVVGGVSR